MANTPRHQQIERLRSAQKSNDSFDDQFERMITVVERNGKRIAVGFIALWVIGLLISLGLLGLVVWAIISIVGAIA